MKSNVGKGIVVTKDGMTKGKQGVIESWESDKGKYKVGFDESWCGWYLPNEVRIDGEPPKDPIVGVAIKYGDLTIALPKPNRHHNLIEYMGLTLGLLPPINATRNGGFYLASGKYLDRAKAKDYAMTIGQLPEDFKKKILTSEDLW